MWTIMLKSVSLPMTKGRADNPAEHSVEGNSLINQSGHLRKLSESKLGRRLKLCVEYQNDLAIKTTFPNDP